MPGPRPTGWLDWVGIPWPVDKRLIYDLGQRGYDRRRQEVLVLRRGKHADHDAAEYEADHYGHDRASEERHLGFGRQLGFGRHGRGPGDEWWGAARYRRATRNWRKSTNGWRQRRRRADLVNGWK